MSETKKWKRKENEIRKKTNLNTIHENITFTFEKEKDNKLPFLDILINNNEPDLQTLVFHTKTYTGLLLNYFSFVPNCYKLGLIKTLVDWMYKINNSWTGFDKDIKDLKNILQKNQYPLKMIAILLSHIWMTR